LPEDGLLLPLAEAKVENFLDNFLEPQCGHSEPFQSIVRTRISLSFPHFSQWNSYIGMTKRIPTGQNFQAGTY
jgi:hypothetical protein